MGEREVSVLECGGKVWRRGLGGRRGRNGGAEVRDDGGKELEED